MRKLSSIRREFFVIGLALGVLLTVTLAVELPGKVAAQDKPKDIPVQEQKTVKKESGLAYIDLRTGVGETVKIGSKLKLFYTGTLKDGTKFESNVGKEPLVMTVGETSLIRGLSEGILGMKQRGKRKLMIPYQLGYGEAGKPPKIPAKADLIFEVEMVEVIND